MTEAEKLIKAYEYNYEVLLPNQTFVITPKDYSFNSKVVLNILGPELFEMFIWENNEIKELHTFNHVGNIGDIYSFLYQFKINNCGDKSRSKRKE